jgi:hypothetical protein
MTLDRMSEEDYYREEGNHNLEIVHARSVNVSHTVSSISPRNLPDLDLDYCEYDRVFAENVEKQFNQLSFANKACAINRLRIPAQCSEFHDCDRILLEQIRKVHSLALTEDRTLNIPFYDLLFCICRAYP